MTFDFDKELRIIVNSIWNEGFHEYDNKEKRFHQIKQLISDGIGEDEDRVWHWMDDYGNEGVCDDPDDAPPFADGATCAYPRNQLRQQLRTYFNLRTGEEKD